MEIQPVREVLVVGAGSAGWLTALALDTYCPFVKVRLIRPRNKPPIGVGESTQGDFYSLLFAAGIDPPTFYKACDATMKCGIFYRDWNRIGDHYWHPFTDLAATSTYTPAHHYQQLILRNPARFTHAGYYAAVHTSYEACVRHNKVAPEAAVAFHIDAQLITGFLEKQLPKVEVIDTEGVDVRVRDGRVSGLVLDGGRDVCADLYVDCTGFSRAIHKHVAAPEILFYEPNVNCAVAAQVPYKDTATELTPYTLAHAHEHGWTWAIPLRSRIGSGYVYHSDFCTKETAEKNFRKYWGDERMRSVEVSHIAFDSQSLANPWAENVVAVGLSSGFVEPLEATGLNWVIWCGHLLSHTLIARFYDSNAITRYNAHIESYIRDVQDFMDIHYMLSDRRDTEFWRYQTSRRHPDRLNFSLELYAREMPTKGNRVRSFVYAFNELSWLDILNGYEFRYAPCAIDAAQAAASEQQLRTIAAQPRRGFDPRKYVPPSSAKMPTTGELIR